LVGGASLKDERLWTMSFIDEIVPCRFVTILCFVMEEEQGLYRSF